MQVVPPRPLPPSPERDQLDGWRRRGLSEPFAVFEVVTPALASLLTHHDVNDRNRRLKLKGPKNSVEAYAAAMRRGEWRVNGETVIVSRTGRLLDAQHRLHALIEADVPVKMLLVFGIEDETQSTLDQGRVRTAKDRLDLVGLKNTNVLGTAIRYVWCYDEAPAFRDYPSAAQEDAILAANPDLHDAITLASRLYRVFRISRPAISAAHSICRRVDAAAADRFIDRVITGLNIDGMRDPIHRLRSKFQYHDSGREKLDGVDQAALYIKAFNAHLKGGPLNTLAWQRLGPMAERFPIAGA